MLFCGIEGGASHSKLVLVTENGEVLCWLDGPSTNYFLIGQDECYKRILDMLAKAKEMAGLDSSITLNGLGLCMSGCESKETNRVFENTFLQNYSKLTLSCTVSSDTFGPLFTANPKGGLVLIAGTGSNAFLLNPDGSEARCGGWGHLIGDESSAIWISLKAVKTVFDVEDNFITSPHDPSKVKELMLKYFNVQNKFGLLDHCYVNFNKAFFAGLCAKLAEVAINEKDPLCLSLFEDAGMLLAKTVIALYPKVHKELLETEGGLPVICVGSVFKSWCLLLSGFEKVIRNSEVKECTLMTLNCSAALGAAYIAARNCNIEIPLDFKKNICIIYHFKA